MKSYPKSSRPRAALSALISSPSMISRTLPPTPAGQVYQLWFADAAGVHPLGTFTFDGVPLTGHPGDTLASALLATGRHLVARPLPDHVPLVRGECRE